MSSSQSPAAAPGGREATLPRSPYRKPDIRRVDLAIEETLSSGCKQWGPGSPCGEDEFSAVLDDGS